jgi:16S rRNA G966 N2-methylase RsmD
LRRLPHRPTQGPDSRQSEHIDRACPDEGDAYRLITGDFANAGIEPNSVDVIITDPPYPAEYLPLYDTLAERAAVWLKPGGSLVALCGHMYLPDIITSFSRHLTYYWSIAYLVPGASSRVWTREVHQQYKPALWFVKGHYEGRKVTDVVKSRGRDKRFHKWGQDEAGFVQLVEDLTKSGDLIADPFCGAGTTGVAALRLGRRFVGIDVDAAALAITASRLAEAAQDHREQADTSELVEIAQ